MTHRLLVLFFLMSGCAASTRFSDRPILWRDPDDRPIPLPRRVELPIQWSGMRDAAFLPADRALALDYGDESWNANALDEVPDSSWFVDLRRAGLEGEARAGLHRLGPETISRGAFGDDPDPVPPFTVVKGKAIGSTPGLVVRDARGQRYLFKLDPPGWLGMNTSTEVVASRLAWAAGWLVPDERVVEVRVEDLRLSADAATKDEWERDIPFSPERLAAILARTPRELDGRVRVCASRWLEGRPLGSWAYTGRRADDLNDRIPHENRRDVRGFGVFAAWVNDIDTMQNNTMDAYVGVDGRGHIVHYQQDVGGSFGQFAAVPATVWMGQETFFMPGRILASLFTFGALERSWAGPEREERRRRTLADHPQLGYFDDDGFDPKTWHPVLDNPAFVRQTRRDHYWGAKRVVAFDEAEVRAAIALGHYPPATEARLFEILWHRRERIARAYFTETAPLDYFQLSDGSLRFQDLWVEAGLGAGGRRYLASSEGRALAIDRDAGVRVPLDDGYHVAVLQVLSAGQDPHRAPRVAVHYVAARGSAHVVGVER